LCLNIHGDSRSMRNVTFANQLKEHPISNLILSARPKQEKNTQNSYFSSNLKDYGVCVIKFTVELGAT